MKDFRDDLKYFENLLNEKKPFSFSKYADGEYAILKNNKITNVDGWTFDPYKHKKEHRKLLESFNYDGDGYYIGISCPCCVPLEHVKWMRNTVKVPNNQLTWANLLVNGNHQYYIDNIVPLFKNYDITFVANYKANMNDLPFDVTEKIDVTDTAWVDDFDKIDELKRDDEGRLYLFSAGPLGNMLAYELWKHNNKNTYLDIGSSLNQYIWFINRGYLKGANTRNKICIW